MISIAVPFTAISVILHISDTFHYRPCNKYKKIFLTSIDKN